MSHKIAGLTDPEWDHHFVSMLDSQLNKFIDTLPVYRKSFLQGHLLKVNPSIVRWDNDHTNSLFKHQSAMIYVTYYNIRMLIHRRFVLGASPAGATAAELPSRSIAANAARSCIRQMHNVQDPQVFAAPTIPVSGHSSMLGLSTDTRTL